MSDGNILDKILTQKHAHDLQTIDPDAIIRELLQSLNDREREVLSRRFGLGHGDGRTATLEEIGTQLEVTRERVRQVTKGAVERLRAEQGRHDDLVRFGRIAEQVLRAYGGALEEGFFVARLRALTEDVTSTADPGGDRNLAFLLKEILADAIERHAASGPLRVLYALPGADFATIRAAVEALEAVVEASQKPLSAAQVVEQFQTTPFYATHRSGFFAEALAAAAELYGGPVGDPTPAQVVPAESDTIIGLAAAAAALEMNVFGEWGKQSWPTVRPKRMNDKIYLVLRHEGKPLHFTAIAERINVARFDHKVAKPPSVHNELILDRRFVLVGRGTYALEEWGFERGTVVEVIVGLLKDRPQLTREEIVEEVLRRRLVKRQTIHLALMDRRRFSREGDGRYVLAASPT